MTQLFIDLANDTSEKIIYVNPGTYDIYQEYRDAQIPTPPDDVTSSDYLTRCVFVPPNTKLIGIGNVTLEWNPAKNDIAKGEARTWSPLNVRYACHIENITIHCKYGRYCIHDDSHNAADDQGVNHTYKNVKCIYEYSEDGYGFNNTIGFGFSQKNTYLFEDCYFENRTTGSNAAFYGHGASGTALNADESPSVTVKNCIIAGGSNNNRVVRLQSLNKSPLKIKTLFEGCYIDGGIYLTLYYNDAIQAFNVALKDSGNPEQTVDNSGANLYPIKIYEPIAVSELKVANTANASNIATLRSDYDSNVFAQKNLLPGSRDLKTNMSGANSVIENGYQSQDYGSLNARYATITPDDSNSTKEILRINNITVYPSKCYTLSFIAKGDGARINVALLSGNIGVKSSINSQNVQTQHETSFISTTNDWQRYWIKWELNDSDYESGTKFISIVLNKDDNVTRELYIAAPQLVLGSDVRTDIEKLQQSAIKKYSVSFSGSLSAGTRLDDAVGMRADVQIGTDASDVVNDFDNVSFFDRPVCCCSWDAESRKWRVNAYEGEPGFARDGSNGEVMYECTPFWYKADFEGEGAPHYVSVTGTPCEGYTLAPMFKNGYDKVYCSSYWMGMVDGKPTSRSGVYGTYGSLDSLMTNARTFDDKAHLETIEMLFSDYLLMLVEFATKDLQTVMIGASSMRYDQEDVVNEVSTSGAATNIRMENCDISNYVVGQTICVGTAKNGENRVLHARVVSVNGGGTITNLGLDTAETSIEVGDYVSSRPWINGATDIITASSGTVANDGKHPCIWRGKVDPWADAFSMICNLLVKQYRDGSEDNQYSYRLQYLTEPWKYVNGGISADYIEANYNLATTSGYVKTVSSDSRYPYIIGTTEVGGTSTNYAAAYYSAPKEGVKIVRYGGAITNARACSPVYFSSGTQSPSAVNWSTNARLFVP